MTERGHIYKLYSNYNKTKPTFPSAKYLGYLARDKIHDLVKQFPGWLQIRSIYLLLWHTFKRIP